MVRNLFAFILVSFIAFTIQSAAAADLMLDTTVKSVTIATDKNSNDYVRFIIVEDKELNGIAYKADTVVMVFGSIVETAKGYSNGDPLKAIVSQNEYKGRTNYSVIAFVE